MVSTEEAEDKSEEETKSANDRGQNVVVGVDVVTLHVGSKVWSGHRYHGRSERSGATEHHNKASVWLPHWRGGGLADVII